MRTDLTLRCEPCRLRFDRAARSCPRCDGPPSPAAEDGAEVEHDPSFAERWDREWEVYAFPVLWVVALLGTGSYIAVATHEHTDWGGFVWPVVWGLVGGFMVGFVQAFAGLFALKNFFDTPRVDRTLTFAMRWMSRVRAQRRSGEVPTDRPSKLELAPIAAEPDTSQTVLRGRARAATPVVSPLDAISCIAFRLVGETPKGAVDDARLAPFEIFANGEWVPVSGEAIVDVAVAPPKRVRAASDALVGFLRERGVWGGDRLRLSESVVESGELLEVSGSPSYEQLPARGYRDGTLRLTALSGTSARPLVIRRNERETTD